MDPFNSTSGVCKKMFIYLKKCTDLSQPLVFEKRKVAYHLTWTNLSQPLVFKNRNVDISYELEYIKSASGV